jgi:hypothetical protein
MEAVMIREPQSRPNDRAYRDGSLSTGLGYPRHVRFSPDSGRRADISVRQLHAKGGSRGRGLLVQIANAAKRELPKRARLSDDVSLWKSSFTKVADIHLGLSLAHTSYPRGKPVGSIDRFEAT